MTTPTTCTTPPDGWACSRPAGHTGPCAATPLPGHSARLRILADAVALTREAQAAGLVLTIETRPQEPLAMGNYFMALDVRSRRDSPQQVAAIGQELGPHPQSRLYGAINNLMAHIGAHGVAYDYDLRVVEVMDALRAVDGGTFQPGLATEAAAMAATVPTRSDQQIVDQTEALADMLMKAFHRREKADPLSTYRGTQDARARQCWLMACEIQEMLTDTDPENAAAEVDDDGAPQAPVAGHPAEPSPLEEAARRYLAAVDDPTYSWGKTKTMEAASQATDDMRAILAPKGDSNG